MARRSANPNDNLTTTMPVHREDFSNESEITMPLGTGEFAEDSVLDPLAGAASAKKLPAGAVIIVSVVVCAIVGLFFMKFVANATVKESLAQDVEKRVDDWIKVIDSAALANANSPGDPGSTKRDNPLSYINIDLSERITPIDDLPRRDPFRLVVEDQSGSVQVTANPGDPAEVILARKQAAKQLEFERAASAFELKMVMGGSKPLANLGGTIVSVGQSITAPNGAVEFTVLSIMGDHVVLEGRDDSISVVMEVTVVLDREL